MEGQRTHQHGSVRAQPSYGRWTPLWKRGVGTHHSNRQPFLGRLHRHEFGDRFLCRAQRHRRHGDGWRVQTAKIVAVWRDGDGLLYVLPPCGRCREFIRQVDPANLDTKVILGSDQSALLRELSCQRMNG